MNEFIRKMQSDKAFAEEFRAYLSGADSKVKEGTRQVGKQLDKVVMDTIKGFAESKGMTLADDPEVSKTLGNMSKQICKQLDGSHFAVLFQPDAPTYFAVFPNSMSNEAVAQSARQLL